jgi:hypothetical protein
MENGSDPRVSEDELAREMIARIARQVDLETGRMPLDAEPDAPADDAAASAVDEPAAELVEEPAELSEEDLSRELVERIAREVDEEPHG